MSKLHRNGAQGLSSGFLRPKVGCCRWQYKAKIAMLCRGNWY